MKMKDLTSLSAKELETTLTENRLKLRELRFKNANGQLKDVREIREVRQLISRLLTLQSAAKTKK
jgi:ribosomal protein L29